MRSSYKAVRNLTRDSSPGCRLADFGEISFGLNTWQDALEVPRCGGVLSGRVCSARRGLLCQRN